LVGEDCAVNVALDQPLTRFLRELAGTKALPPLAILNGNPRVAGRRFVILIFGADARPVAIVKAGMGEAAAALIRREAAFLKSLPPRKPGIPAIRAGCVSSAVAAFAMDFVPGDCPRDASRISELLTGWVDQERMTAIGELPQWRELERAWSGAAQFVALQKELTAKKIHPVISHGDLAPWNIKVAADNSWVVLDWERGEPHGIPAWDCFHFLIQPLLLVQRRPAGAIVARLEVLLGSAEFRAYANASGITGVERPLLVGYLAYMQRVIRPSEGLAATGELLNLVVNHRRPGA
jgi:hypothetical protein